MTIIWKSIIGLVSSSLIFGIPCVAASILLSPMQFLKILRQETNASYLNIAQEYYAKGGIKIFFRGWKPYALMQFISSVSFGVSEYIVTTALIYWSYSNFVGEIVFRVVLGAIFETFSTIHAEVAEIARNKKEFVKVKTKVSVIVLAIFLRNAIFWLGGVFAYKVASVYNLSYASGAGLAFLCGVACAILSIPLDAAATRMYGSNVPMSLKERIKASYKRGGPGMLLAGAEMRILQIAIYTMVTELTMTLLLR